MATTHLYLVRHGETLWNAEQRMQGHLNSDLTARGKEQARLLGEKLADLPIEACYSSDSQRAWETAQLVTQHLAVKPKTDRGLREIAMGSWEGRTQQEIQVTDADEWQRFWETPDLFEGRNGGEQFAALDKRVSATLNKLITAHSGKNILLVSHRLTIKTMVNTLIEQPLAELHHLTDIKPNSLSVLAITKTKTDIIDYSNTSHYE